MSMGTKRCISTLHYTLKIQSKHFHLIFHYDEEEEEEDVLNNGFQTPLTLQ